MRRPESYQTALIAAAIAVVALTGLFVYRELRPEYKEYQQAYIDLEEFRSSYTGEPPPPFKKHVRQILVQDQDVGPETVDRCTSCHVAMKLPHFSPTQLARDINGNIVYNNRAEPVQIPNEEYLFSQVEARIKELRNPELNEALSSEGKEKTIEERLRQAQQLEGLIYRRIDGQEIDMRKVLVAHPLMANETRPFEFHPMEVYGCTSCHSGNGRSITLERAHGPVWEGTYEPNPHATLSPFVEVDPEHDPEFARVFLTQPSHDLLFQTQPILPSSLMQSRCLQCHQFAEQQFQNVVASIDLIVSRKQDEVARLREAVTHDKQALASLLTLSLSLRDVGLAATRQAVAKELQNPRNSPNELDGFAEQAHFLEESSNIEELQAKLERQMVEILGSRERVASLKQAVAADPLSLIEAIDTWVSQQGEETGPLWKKIEAISQGEEAILQMRNAEQPLALLSADKELIATMADPADAMLADAHRGKQLFIQQACYACHRIEGLSRGNVGPELTEIGLMYPWYVRLSIVWPQGKIPSSAMPNFRLDHQEVEDLMAFLMAQTSNESALTEVDRQAKIEAWEANRMMPWERPVPPSEIRNLETGMTLFATEGCASCHRLVGYESNVDYRFDTATPSPDQKLKASQWFRSLFPETISGHELANTVREEGKSIDAHISEDVRENAILERLQQKYPGVIESYYTNFAVARRTDDKAAFQRRLYLVMMMYIQEYGLGRNIGPQLSWSGVFRDDEWLLGHFHNPAAYTAKSIMPVMPFDNSKFYALNYMLHKLAAQNRDQLRALWSIEGFDPALAYQRLCSSCHGVERQGNGMIGEYIYPIPKNLRNATFLRNQTRSQIARSIQYGVPGTPMPPWGEVIPEAQNVLGSREPILTPSEVEQIVDWLFASLPGQSIGNTEEQVDKWQLSPEEVIEQLEQEGSQLRSNSTVGPGSFLSAGFALLASSQKAPTPVEEIFDVVDSPDRPGGKAYYIKRRYYTEANLLAGEELFQRNCSHCHGPDGEGNGARAENMVDAKPRMLTNLPWIEARDDMRLLRSIQYGVPGTAMTPWGDKTSMLQRMQLVMYIRTLSDEKGERAELEEVLYNHFDRASMLVENCRINSYGAVAEAQKHYLEAVRKREELYETVQLGGGSIENTSKAYEQELEALGEVQVAKARDTILVELIQEIEHERELIALAGRQLVGLDPTEAMLQNFFELIDHHSLRYTPSKQCFTIEPPLGGDYEKRLIDSLDRWIAVKQTLFQKLQGKIWNPDIAEREQVLMEEINRLNSVRTSLINQLRLSERSQERQMKIYREFTQHQGDNTHGDL